jgi:hypothetical protein
MTLGVDKVARVFISQNNSFNSNIPSLKLHKTIYYTIENYYEIPHKIVSNKQLVTSYARTDT